MGKIKVWWWGAIRPTRSTGKSFFIFLFPEILLISGYDKFLTKIESWKFKGNKKMFYVVDLSSVKSCLFRGVFPDLLVRELFI